ncbi:TonB-dependent receptor [Kineobactrum sediminis]|nr:TonB-dependent receptor [Kineobactrum sediminis]
MLKFPRFRPRPLALALSPLIMSLGMAAQAQAVALEEVIVTAQKRAEGSQDTPLSITALSEKVLEQRGINSTSSMIGEVLGVGGFEAPGSRGATSLSIRGFGGGSGANLSTDPAVGIYMDGVYIGKMNGSGMDVAELERIEVLRGPQGTLYGRNSTAGAINFISKQPTGEFGFRAKGTLGNYDERGLRLNTDLPAVGEVGEGLGRLSASLGYQTRERDPFYDNTSGGEGFDSIDRQAWRLALKWELTDSLTADYAYDGSRLDETSAMQQVVGFTPVTLDGSSRIETLAQLRSFMPLLVYPGSDPRISERLIPSMDQTLAVYNEIEAQGPGRADSGAAENTPIADNEVSGHALTFTWDAGDMGAFGDVTFKSITAYREMDTYVFGDLDNIDSSLDANGVGAMNDLILLQLGSAYFGSGGQPSPTVDFFWNGVDTIGAYHSKQDTRSEYEQFSQEFNIIGATDRLDYVLGLYYFDDEAIYDRQAVFLAPLGGTGTQQYDYTTESLAVFGQATWVPPVLEERLSVTAGLRYTEEDKAISYDYLNRPFGAPSAGIPAQADLQENFYNLSGSFTAAYQVTDGMNAFLRYATGYRSGGFNGEVFANPFEEETMEQWELGIKSDWWDNRLRVNGSLYTFVYEDLQTSQIKTDSGTATSVIANAGEADRWGGELEILVAPIEDLVLGLNYAYVTGDFEKFPELCGTNVPQTCLSTVESAKRGSSPGNQLTASADYVFARTSFGDIRGYVQANWQEEWYESALWTGSYNGEPYIYDHLVMDERTLVNARLSLENVKAGDGTVTVSLWGKNLTDNDYPTFGINFGALGIITEQYGAPRTYGLDISYEY